MTYEHKDVMRWAAYGLSRTKAAGVDVHGFGVTRWNAIWDLPWSSVDSTTWQNGSRYGSVLLFTGKRLFQARAHQLVDNLPHVRANGFTLDDAFEMTRLDTGHPERRINGAICGLRSLAHAQAAVRARHANPNFTIYCAAVLESEKGSKS